MKNRFNKPAPAEYAPRVEKKEVTLVFKPCCVCGKQIQEGYYARIADGGTCNKTCWNTYQRNKPSLIDYVIPGGNHENTLRKGGGIGDKL